ncbi:hypothetical protein BIW11_04544 [Tropilaelaps mercedesae]|uniref:Uncharacterized protein n=1 Tax=Tropilaelaps mercedesae TaxID=418985 RepID=A0A1V9X531_9ACAR|nr:hypothetical protein BIW11_04544 [Tropilaelaps mercedesae]
MQEVNQLSYMQMERNLPLWAVNELLGDGKNLLKQLRAKTNCYMYVSHGNPPKITVIADDPPKRRLANMEIDMFLTRNAPRIIYPMYWYGSP